MNIIPAIIGKNIEEIRDKVEEVQNHVKWIQIDVMDGIFTPQKSWPYIEGEFSDLELIDSIRKDELKLEFHLMVERPEEIVSELVSCGADRIIFHQEATERADEIIKYLEDEEVGCGIALKFDTELSTIDKYLPDIDLVQLMSIREIGSYGQKFEEGVFKKIINLKKKHPGLEISVDGGVSLEDIERLKAAGVENFVVGSAIFGSEDIIGSIEKFKEIIK